MFKNRRNFFFAPWGDLKIKSLDLVYVHANTNLEKKIRIPR